LMLTKNLGDVLEQSRNKHTFKLEMKNITWKILQSYSERFCKN